MAGGTLTAVKSSTISHVGYDKDSETLTVKFTHGGTYEYSGVPQEQHDALIGSESIGKHFHAQIRPKYVGKKLEPVAS